MKSPITTHVLDTHLGRPGVGIAVQLEQAKPSLGDNRAATDEVWARLGAGTTDGDGRVGDLWPGGELTVGNYRLIFLVRAYFERSARAAFFPQVVIPFRVETPAERYHVPVLLSPFSYTTYRGS